MKKLLFLVILALVFSGHSLMAQETVTPPAKKHQQFYVSTGPGTAFTNSKLLVSTGSHSNLLVTATYPSNKLLRGGFSFSNFSDNQPITREFLKDNPDRGAIAHHTITSLYFALGKRKLLNKYVQLQALAGLSFTRHHGVENIHRYTLTNGFGDTQEYINFTMGNRFVPGIVMQAEVMALPLPFAGLTLGGYYNFIPKISHAGLNLNLNLGRIRLKT